MARFARRLGRVALATGALIVFFVVLFLIGWAVVFTFPIVWRVLVAGLAGGIAYRIVNLGPRADLLRLFAALAVALVIFLLIRGDEPSTGGHWIMFVVLLVLPVYAAIQRGLPHFFAPPPANRPDATKEDRSPREFTSDDAARLVDALDAKWGTTRSPPPAQNPGEPRPRPGRRAVHSHGSWAKATFEPTPPRRAMGNAAGADRDGWFDADDYPLLAQGRPLRAIVRFSNFSGDPQRNDQLSEPHGMAIKLFVEPDAGDATEAGVDLLGLDIKRFMVRSREDFMKFSHLLARPGWARYPGWLLMAATGRTTVQSILGMRVKSTIGYGDRLYHGQNTFWAKIRDPSGELEPRVPVRYRFVPTHVAGPRPLEPDRHRLDKQLRTQLEAGRPLRYRIELVDGRGVAEKNLDNPIRPWPPDQPAYPMGMLIIDEFIEDGDITEPYQSMVFDAHRLCKGLRASDDEILMARRAAYPVSHLRRLKARS